MVSVARGWGSGGRLAHLGLVGHSAGSIQRPAGAMANTRAGLRDG